jgi:hypothetical protein
MWYLFPDVIAEVFYCHYGKVWGIRGDGVQPESLDISAPKATDFAIVLAVSALPIEYRVRIIRQQNDPRSPAFRPSQKTPGLFISDANNKRR